jgi:uncharacterized protein
MTSNERRIGVISDTHGKLDSAVPEIFQGVDRIIHAGDVGDEAILWKLEDIAPVVAVRGNNDNDTLCVPNERLFLIDDKTLFVLHQFATADKLNKRQQELIERRMLDVVIFGHSHKAYVGEWRGTILFNPGGAGPKRFSLPRTVGILEIKNGEIEARIVTLPDSPTWI